MGCVQSRVRATAEWRVLCNSHASLCETLQELKQPYNAGYAPTQAECFNAKSKHLASLKSCGSSFRQQLSDKKLISPTSGKHLEAGAEPLATVFHSSFGNSSLVSTTDSEGVACKDCIKAQQPCEGNNCPDDDGQLLGLSPEQLDATPVACVVGHLLEKSPMHVASSS